MSRNTPAGNMSDPAYSEVLKMSDDPAHPRTECYFCNAPAPLETHHVFPRRYGGTDTKSNLVDLCEGCHKKLESLYDEKTFWSKLPIETGEYPPRWGPLDDVVIVNWAGVDSSSVRDYEPECCAKCERAGPFKSVTHQPTGFPAWQCVRCASPPDSTFGNSFDWSGLHVLTDDQVDESDVDRCTAASGERDTIIGDEKGERK